MKDKTIKRQLIMDAALQVFVQNGYEKTKIIDVAKTAGIGKGTVYEYFSSKEELIARAVVSFTLPAVLGFTGICLAGPIAWMAAAIPLGITYFVEIKKMMRDWKCRQAIS